MSDDLGGFSIEYDDDSMIKLTPDENVWTTNKRSDDYELLLAQNRVEIARQRIIRALEDLYQKFEISVTRVHLIENEEEGSARLLIGFKYGDKAKKITYR